jgi:hypothetical protein
MQAARENVNAILSIDFDVRVLLLLLLCSSFDH